MCEGGNEDDGFFDMLTKSQGRRLDDQRCTFVPSSKKSPSHKGLNNTDELLDILQKLNDRYAAGVKHYLYHYLLHNVTGCIGWKNRDLQNKNQLLKHQI